MSKDGETVCKHSKNPFECPECHEHQLEEWANEGGNSGPHKAD